MEPGDEVMVVVGNRVITTASVLKLMEGMRVLTTAEGGGELLLRFFPDKLETIGIPYPSSYLALQGMSHLRAAELVISIRHAADRPDDEFIAIAVLPDGSNTVFLGVSEGPLTVLPDVLDQLPQMQRVMGRIACNDPDVAGTCPSVLGWLLRVSLEDVADKLGDDDDSIENAAYADRLLRETISAHVAGIGRAAGSTPHLRTATRDWTALFESAAFLGGVNWIELDGEALAAARGYDPSMGAWWTARGLACLDLANVPELDERLQQLAIDRPTIARQLRDSLDQFALRVSAAEVPPERRARDRWRADDPDRLVRFIRKILADTDFPSGVSLIGYRRSGSQLHQVGRIDSVVADNGMPTLDFMSFETVGPAEGIVLIANNGRDWTASAVNREGEHGTATTDPSGIGVEFMTPVDDEELLAMLRRLLTGHAQPQLVFGPRDWAYRRILYGVALTLESGHLDGEKEAEPRKDEEQMTSAKTDLADLESPASFFIDVVLTGLIPRHLGTLVDSMRSGPRLTAVPLDFVPDDERWGVYSEVMNLIRLLDWSTFRVAPLAAAWGAPVDHAEWWGADGLALRQSWRIPEATESLLRCAFVLKRTADGSTAFDHLIRRTKQIFGDDIPVLWSFLSEMSHQEG